MALKKVLAPVIADRTCRTCGRDIAYMPKWCRRCDACHRELEERLGGTRWERVTAECARIDVAPPYRGRRGELYWMDEEDDWDYQNAFTWDAGDRL